jgi:hypothetical protein
MPGSISRLTNPPDVAEFKIELDPLAEQWLKKHHAHTCIVITLSLTRCCGGPPVRDVRLRVDGLEEARGGGFVRIGCVADRDVYIDHRLRKPCHGGYPSPSTATAVWSWANSYSPELVQSWGSLEDLWSPLA